MKSSPLIPAARRRILTPHIILQTAGITIPSSEWILRQHTRVLSRMFRRRNLHTRRLAFPAIRLFGVVEEKTELLRRVKRSRLNLVPILIRLAYHEEDWIRPPEIWIPDHSNDPDLLLRGLIDHLLVRYPVPSFSYSAWKIDGPLRHVEREWFCHLGKGESLRSFPGWVPSLSRRALSIFQQATGVGSIREAIRFAQIAALSPTPSFFDRILSTRLANDFSHDHVWLPLVEMWIKSPAAREDEFGLVVDYVWSRCHLNGPRSFRLRGRTCETLVRSALFYFRELTVRFTQGRSEATFDDVELIGNGEKRSRLLRLHADSWDPFLGGEVYEKISRGWFWRIEELCNPVELAEEGTDMEHCVGLYAGDCKKGRSAIFSLRSRKLSGGSLDRELTIEVDRRRRSIVQVKAWRNRRCHGDARRVVIRWCEENRIETGAWSMW